MKRPQTTAIVAQIAITSLLHFANCKICPADALRTPRLADLKLAFEGLRDPMEKGTSCNNLGPKFTAKQTTLRSMDFLDFLSIQWQ